MAGEPTIIPPRRRHALALALGALGGVAAAVAAGRALGGDWASSAMASAVVVQSVLLGSVVLLLGGPIRLSVWGMAALAGSIGRVLAVLALGLTLDLLFTLDRTPFWMGVVAGSVVVLVLDSALIIRVAQGYALGGAAADGAEHA